MASLSKFATRMWQIDSAPKTFSPWWSKQITTLEELDACCRRDEYSLVAFDTEFNHAAHSSEMCLEVGFSFLPTLGVAAASGGERHLRKLAEQYSIETRCAWVTDRHPYRKHERFNAGSLERVHSSELGGYVDSVVQDFKQKARRPLMLVGFSMPADLIIMYNEFSQAARHFSAWVDLNKVLDNARHRMVPGLGLGASLSVLGYTIHDGGGPSSWRSHSAGNDAIRTLALLEGLQSMDSELKEGLQLSRNSEGKTDPCRRPRLYVWETPPRRTRMYVANIVAEGATRLPSRIDSVYKLSCYLHERGHCPCTLAGYGDTRDSKARRLEFHKPHTSHTGRVGAWAIFNDEATLINFVSVTDEQVVDGITLKVTIRDSKEEIKAQKTQREEIRALREQKRRQKRDLDHDPESDEDGILLNLDNLMDAE
ncbi:hypothetical protein F4778DRAFT_346240 [Xylariomycetidae sp. FL2044]|nr:hypothetical protein F4778DRAFT_346240 [Xylariomycetidae sp. FL2044]